MTRFDSEQPKCRSGDDRVLLIEHSRRLSDRLRSKNVDSKFAI
jgi:hypothetical protein